MKRIVLTESDFNNIVSEVVREILIDKANEINGKYDVYYEEVDELVKVVIDTNRKLVIVGDNRISGKEALRAIDWIIKQKKYSNCSTEEAIESWLHEISR